MWAITTQCVLRIQSSTANPQNRFDDLTASILENFECNLSLGQFRSEREPTLLDEGDSFCSKNPLR